VHGFAGEWELLAGLVPKIVDRHMGSGRGTLPFGTHNRRVEGRIPSNGRPPRSEEPHCCQGAGYDQESIAGS
jgi:hypothetical protein